jgi:hypothetical protein
VIEEKKHTENPLVNKIKIRMEIPHLENNLKLFTISILKKKKMKWERIFEEILRIQKTSQSGVYFGLSNFHFTFYLKFST